MKTLTVDEFRTQIDQLLEHAPSDDVLVVRDGKPLAMLCAVTDESDDDSSEFTNDPKFWEMIEERRREPTIPLAEVKRMLGIDG